ncbi:MAG: hypothetical protein ACE5HY_02375 [Candidatus Hydrothermarchaeales archaeon]
MKIKLPFDLKDVKPGEFSYLTKRLLENKEGEETGELFIWRKSGEEEYNYVMLCPYCAEEQKGATIFTRRPYRIRCSKCDKSIVIKRLKDEAKKK